MCTLQSTKSNILYLMIITIYHKIYIKVCQVFIFVSVINLTQVWCYYYKPVITIKHACFDKVQNPYKYLYISLYNFIYCRSGNIREVLIFANFARRTNSRIQEPRENYHYNSATEKNLNSRILNFVKSPKIRNSRKIKHAKITRFTVYIF